MINKNVVAMILAGGQGSRLGELTKRIAKPAVSFAGKYKIIDFPLSNCFNSGIDIVGVLTQYRPLKLNEYIGDGGAWGLNRKDGNLTILPPYQREFDSEWYKGTANAIYQNIEFMERYNPKYVLVLSGDHIYKMDYGKMIKEHEENLADVTISVMEVSKEEASRFGIMNTGQDNRIYEFEEKPKNPKSNKASMGIYVFNFDTLKEALSEDEADKNSSNDFGKNIIPKLVDSGKRVFAYDFKGYWKDVGTIESLWEANLDMLSKEGKFNIEESDWRIYSNNFKTVPQYIGEEAEISNSIISDGCSIYGKVYNSVISSGVTVGKNTVIRNSVIMDNSNIDKDVDIDKSILGINCRVNTGSKIKGKENIVVVKDNAVIEKDSVVK